MSEAADGFEGLEGFRTPLDLAQQPGTGNLFVVDLLDKAIYFLSPKVAAAEPGAAEASAETLHFNGRPAATRPATPAPSP